MDTMTYYFMLGTNNCLYIHIVFSPRRRVQTGSEAHPASPPVGTGVLSSW